MARRSMDRAGGSAGTINVAWIFPFREKHCLPPLQFQPLTPPLSGIPDQCKKWSYLMAEAKKCGCGRSPSGKCIGWHGLSEDEYQKKLAAYQAGKTQKAGRAA